MWDFNLFIEQDISDKKYIAFSEVNGAVNWATTVTNNKKTELKLNVWLFLINVRSYQLKLKQSLKYIMYLEMTTS